MLTRQLVYDYLQRLSTLDPCYFEDWFISESTIPIEIHQFCSKFCIRLKKKNNFIVLLDLFLANEENSWIFVFLNLLVMHVMETYMSPIDTVRMHGKFEFLFKLLGIDIYFPSAYDFIPYARALIETLASDEAISIYTLAKVELLQRLFTTVSYLLFILSSLFLILFINLGPFYLDLQKKSVFYCGPQMKIQPLLF